MILDLSPLPVGNAMKISLQPPAGTVLTRLLRKLSDTFTDQADTGALVAYEGSAKVIVDAEPVLANGVPVFYKPFYFSGVAWSSDPSVSGIPAATYEDNSTDVQELIRSRMEVGMAVEVARDFLKPFGHATIEVKTAPPVAEETMWPVLTVQLVNESSGARALGEQLTADTFDSIGGMWDEHLGTLADVSVMVAAWTTNPDERILLRKVIRRLLVANLEVFDAAGMLQVAWSFNDSEFLNGEFKMNVFQTAATITCSAPVIVSDGARPINEVDVVALDTFN